MRSLEKWLPFSRNRSDLPAARSSGSSVAVHPIVQMRREMDDVFDRVFSSAFGAWSNDLDAWPGHFAPGTFAPSVDIADEAKHIRVTAELPGLEPKDVDLWVQDNALYMRGEKTVEESNQDERYYRTERSYGRFERIVPLPVEVDAGGAEATYRQGVLTVRLPKTGESAAPAKPIPIRTG